jgi:hypothetical protein
MLWKNRDIWMRLEFAAAAAAVVVLIVASWFRQ